MSRPNTANVVGVHICFVPHYPINTLELNKPLFLVVFMSKIKTKCGTFILKTLPPVFFLTVDTLSQPIIFLSRQARKHLTWISLVTFEIPGCLNAQKYNSKAVLPPPFCWQAYKLWFTRITPHNALLKHIGTRNPFRFLNLFSPTNSDHPIATRFCASVVLRGARLAWPL